jgi:hypothetical protein
MQSYQSAIRPKCEVQASGSDLFYGLSTTSDNKAYVILCSIVLIVCFAMTRGDGGLLRFYVAFQTCFADSCWHEKVSRVIVRPSTEA